MNSPVAASRIKDLTRLLHHYNERYYCGESEIDDMAYDALRDELAILEQKHPRERREDSPNARISGDPQSAFTGRGHRTPMLSLGNVYSLEELREWAVKTGENLGSVPEFVCELKIDGLALSIIYENGKLAAGVSRGDGNEGDDITPNLKTLESLPHSLKNLVNLEVRGEVYMPKNRFIELNLRREKLGEPLFKNPRNAAAGSLRMLDSTEVRRRRLDLFVYMNVNGEGRHSQQLEELGRLGLPVNPETRTCASIDEVEAFCQYWETHKGELPYEIDGVVVKVNDLQLQHKLGFTAKSPRWATAFKFTAEQAVSTLRAVEIGVGRSGVLTPVALVDPVELNNTMVSRATLHNYDQAARLGLHLPDRVVLEKGGEIIPKIVKVDPDVRPTGAWPVTPPETCPVCNGQAGLIPEGVDWRCTNPQCPAQLNERILHFVSRRAMDIEAIGPALVEQLVSSGMLKSFADLYRLRYSDLLRLERMGEKSAHNVINSIERSKQCNLPQFLHALGIPHVGEKIAGVLAREFCTLDRLREINLETLEQINEVGPVIAKSVVGFFHDPLQQSLVDQCRAHGVEPMESMKDTVVELSFFSGKSIVITGTLTESRDTWKSRLLAAGANVTGSVSGKTDYLLAGENPGAKLLKARSLNIEVLDETRVRQELNLEQTGVPE